MDIFLALAEPTRRSIIEILAKRNHLFASEIYKSFNVTESAISQHLKVLKEANLVIVEKQAQHRIYKLNPLAIKELEHWTNKLHQLEQVSTEYKKI